MSADDTQPSLSRVHGVIEVEAPGGIKARAKGYRLMDAVCLISLCLTLYVTYAVADHRRESDQGFVRSLEAMKAAYAPSLEIQKALLQEFREQVKEQKANVRAVEELTCVTTLPIEARAKGASFCKDLIRPSEHRGR